MATARPSPTSSPIWHCRLKATATTNSPGDVVRRILELWEEGRVDAVLSHLHPDIEWSEPPGSPDRAVVTGRDAALSALMMWLSTWASYENELLDMSEHGENV